MNKLSPVYKIDRILKNILNLSLQKMPRDTGRSRSRSRSSSRSVSPETRDVMFNCRNCDYKSNRRSNLRRHITKCNSSNMSKSGTANRRPRSVVTGSPMPVLRSPRVRVGSPSPPAALSPPSTKEFRSADMTDDDRIILDRACSKFGLSAPGKLKSLFDCVKFDVANYRLKAITIRNIARDGTRKEIQLDVVSAQ